MYSQVVVINSNPTGTVEWKAKNFTDCFKATPNQLSFDGENFQ